MTNENKDKIAKIYELVKRGATEGEKQAAELALNKLLKKYNLTDEFLETKRLLLKIAGHKDLMENYPDGKASIDMRERIVLPLLTIQQYALLKINELNKATQPNDELIKVYEKIVTRSLFGNTNASRNSA